MAGIEHDRLTSAESRPQDKAFDRAIRPKLLEDWGGQPAVNQQMGIFIEAARRFYSVEGSGDASATPQDGSGAGPEKQPDPTPEEEQRVPKRD